MPPTFLYLLALVVYVGAALLVWAGCAVAALVPRTRRGALRTAAAMLGSFPGVFAAQAALAPLVVAGVMLCVGVLLLATGGQPKGSPLVSVAAALSVLGALTAFAFASLYGFVVGWRVGWRVSAGEALGVALGAYPPLDLALDARGGWLRRHVDAIDRSVRQRLVHALPSWRRRTRLG